MKKNTKKATKKSKAKVKAKAEKSLAETVKKYHEEVYGGLAGFKVTSDNEVLESVFPTQLRGKITIGKQGGAGSYTQDAIASPQYNGPIPLGFHTISPQSIPLNGIVGNAIRHFAARNFFWGFQLCAWAKQHVFVSKACDMPGEDAVACGFEFKLDVPRGTQKLPKGYEESLKFAFDSEEFGLPQTLRLFESNRRCFGGALAIPCFEEDVDMSAPLVDYSQLRGKTFLGWTVIDPYYLSPYFGENDRAILDPSYKFYLEPTAWNVYGSTDSTGEIKRVHRSWCFFRRHIVLASIYRPSYLFFGPSVPQMIMERLYSAEICANETSMLLRSKRTFVVETDLRKMIANPEWMEKYLKATSENADNWGTRLVERGSNAKQMDSYLSECMPLTMAQYGILCAEIGIPAPKFMMAQLTGFANSGNYEIKLYADGIRKIHTDDLIPLVKKTISIKTACDTGVPMRSNVEFGEVDIPTIVENAQIMYEKARSEKFVAEAKAVREMAKREDGKPSKSAETHKSAKERIS